MADDEGIRDVYRIAGVRNIGTSYVFPKSRVAKKKQKPFEEELEQKEAKEQDVSSPDTTKNKGIDIEA